MNRQLQFIKLHVESGVAISDRFHGQRGRFDLFYQANADNLSGFPGIWKLITDVAIGFQLAWLDRNNDDGWLDAVGECASNIYDVADEMPVGDGGNEVTARFIVEVVKRTMSKYL